MYYVGMMLYYKKHHNKVNYITIRIKQNKITMYFLSKATISLNCMVFNV